MAATDLLQPPPPEAFLPMPRAFFEKDALTVARQLLGRFLVHEEAEGRTVGRIVETEAYTGPEDKAAHVAGNRRTERTEVFWGPGGHAYVYLVYGMHLCFNVVAGRRDEPCAVLVRALEPVEGVGVMERRRGLDSPEGRGIKAHLAHLARLTDGPGKLAQAMGVTKAHYGADLVGGPLRITQGRPVGDDEVATSPRVGVGYAEEYADMPWRFFVRGSPCVSKP